MLLINKEIQQYINDGVLKIDPFDSDMIDTVSIDIRMGDDLQVWRKNGWVKINLSNHGKRRPYQINSGEFFLTNTYEKLELPNFLTGELTIKSGRARQGYNHSLSGLIKPGFQGRLTMEFKNYLTGRSTLDVFYKMPIAQIKFFLHKPVDVRPSQFDGHNGVVVPLL